MSVLFRYDAEHVHVQHTRDNNPRAEDFPMHAHDIHELFYFISGRGSYFVEANEYRLYPGCIMLMRAGETHKLQISPELPYERLVINFSTSLLSQIDPRNQLTDAFINRSAGQRNLYGPDILNMDLIHSCLNTLSVQGRITPDNQKTLLLLSYLCPVLFEINRCFHNKSVQGIAYREGTVNIVSQLVEYINTHLCEDFTLDTLSDHFFTSKIHLNNQFKQVTGSTIWEYTVIKRLILARQYIRDGMSAGEAATASGWNDYSAFYRSYKSRFGVSPSADRPSLSIDNLGL